MTTEADLRAEADRAAAERAKKTVADATKELELAKEILGVYKEKGATIDEAQNAWDKIQQKQADVLKARIREEKDLTHTNAARVIELERALELHEKQFSAVKNIRNETESLIDGLSGMSSKWKKSFIGGLVDPAVSLQDKLTGVHQGLVKSVTTANLLGSSMQKIVELSGAAFMELQQGLPAFNAATGQAGAMNSQIIELTAEVRRYGLGMTEAQEATSALMAGMGNFNQMTPEGRQELAAFATGLTKLGVDVQTSTSLFNSLTNALGYSGDQVKGVAFELMGTATAMDVPVQQLIKGLDQSMPRLAMYGSRAVEVFKKVAQQSKATGIETQKLLDIVARFDTFEGAADAAGRLNAILGGAYINSVELMRAEEGEKIEILKRGMDASNRSWEAMDRQTQMATAGAIGLTDYNEAAKLFTSSLKDLENGFGEAAVQEENFNEMVEQATTLAEKFQAFWMAAIQPLIPAIQWVIEGLGSLIDRVMALGTGWTATISAATLLIGLFVTFKLVTWLVGVAIGWVGTSAAATVPALTALNAVITAAVPLVTALGLSSTTLIPVLALITIAIVAVAAAIAVLVWGVVRIVQAFTNLATVMIQNKDALGPFAVALAAVVATAYMLANPVALGGLAALVAGITGVGLAMHTLPLAKLQEFNEMMTTVTEAAKAGVTVKGTVGFAKTEIEATGGAAAVAGALNKKQEIKVEIIFNNTDELSKALEKAMDVKIGEIVP